MKKLTRIVELLAVFVATMAVNSTCWFTFYQEELPTSVLSLRKHNE